MKKIPQETILLIFLAKNGVNQCSCDMIFCKSKVFLTISRVFASWEFKYKYYQYFLTVLDLGGCGGICSFLEMEACEIKRAESNFYYAKNFSLLMYNDILPI